MLCYFLQFDSVNCNQLNLQTGVRIYIQIIELQKLDDRSTRIRQEKHLVEFHGSKSMLHWIFFTSCEGIELSDIHIWKPYNKNKNNLKA